MDFQCGSEGIHLSNPIILIDNRSFYFNTYPSIEITCVGFIFSFGEQKKDLKHGTSYI
jgi:hypothetical protein